MSYRDIAFTLEDSNERLRARNARLREAVAALLLALEEGDSEDIRRASDQAKEAIT